MIDPAFLAFSETLERLLDIPGECVDHAAGVRSHIYECTIEMPVELDVTRDTDGRLVLGSVPPLYYVSTTFQPAYHHIRFTATKDEAPDGR